MKCCAQCDHADKWFDDKYARDDLEAYRQHGPSKPTQLLIDQLVQQGVQDMTLLDIGGGVGAIQHELIKSGVRSVTGVDASKAFIGAARHEAERQGYADRVQYQVGDFVKLAHAIEPADIVTLDRVVCCYPDMPALVGESAARARHYYALVFPRDALIYRAVTVALNSFERLSREPFFFFVHPTARVDRLICEQGFEKLFHRKLLIWQVLIYQRVN
jgi:magnesium-protoporphyrin O-methyltransferase